MKSRRNAMPRKETRRQKIADQKPKVSTYQSRWVPKPLEAKTPRQKEYLNSLRTSYQTFAIGSAGTGKTYLPTCLAADLLKQGQIDKIILTRPNVPGGPSLGYFTGDINEKMEPWVIPFVEAIRERIGPTQTEYYLETKQIEIAPFETMRGRTFKEAFVIVDEAQNLTPNEMFMVLTRAGEDCQLVVTGDYVRQKDIRGQSGLQVAIETIEKHGMNADIIEFGPEDIVRSGICRQWVMNWPNLG